MRTDAQLSEAVERLNLVRKEIGKIIVGQSDVVDGVLICSNNDVDAIIVPSLQNIIVPSLRTKFSVRVFVFLTKAFSSIFPAFLAKFSSF